MGTTESLNVLNALSQKMGWLEENQKRLAENISNADTRGFQPSELKPIDFRSMLEASTSHIPVAKTGENLSMASTGGKKTAGTNAMHMSVGTTSSAAGNKEMTSKQTYETAPAKNAVILEEQLLKMSENYADHRLISNLYQKNIDMLKLSTKTQ